MEVQELWSLLAWFQKNVVEPRIHKKYGALHSVLNQNTQPNQAKVSMEQQANDLTASLRAMPIHELTTQQVGYLSRLGVADFFGERGAAYVEEVLYKNAIDPATAMNRIEPIMATLNRAIDKTNKTREGLADVVTPGDAEVLNLFRVTFVNDASINNVVDLKKWSNDWFTIARGVVMAHDLAPNEVKVVSAQSGSIIISFGLCLVALKTLSTIVERALVIANSVQDVRLKSEQIRSLKLNNDLAEQKVKAAAEQLQAAAKTERDERTEQIAKEVSQSIGLKRADGEKMAALSKSVKLIVQFIDKGGEVDIFVEPEGDTNETSAAEDAQRALRQEIRDRGQTIRRIEDDKRRLGYIKEGDGDAEVSDNVED